MVHPSWLLPEQHEQQHWRLVAAAFLMVSLAAGSTWAAGSGAGRGLLQQVPSAGGVCPAGSSPDSPPSSNAVTWRAGRWGLWWVRAPAGWCVCCDLSRLYAGMCSGTGSRALISSLLHLLPWPAPTWLGTCCQANLLYAVQGVGSIPKPDMPPCDILPRITQQHCWGRPSRTLQGRM
jgi:hypothetical protein